MSDVAVSFGGVTVGVRADGERAERLAAFAVRHLSRGAARPDDVHLDLGEGPDGFVLRRGDEVLARDAREGGALDALMGSLTFHLVDRGRELLLHAGLIAHAGAALLFPAASGAGKSTLTAWLCARGASLASDELVRLDGQTAWGLPRPLHLKKGSRAIASALLSGVGSAHHVAWEEGDFVHAEGLGAEVSAGPLRVSAIVFPRWEAGARALLRPVRPAEAARRLMETLVNARNLEGHGFARACDLARAVPTFDLRYSALEAAARLLERDGALSRDPSDI